MKKLIVNNLLIEESNEKIVKNISFEVEKSLIIIGQSGSGKTMTCNSILGLLNRKNFKISGEILFDDVNLINIKKKERVKYYGKSIAYIPQNPMNAFDPSRKIYFQMDETLKLHVKLKKEERKKIIMESINKAGIEDAKRICDSYPFMLSGGLLQRVMIAISIMTNAELIIADEPTTALDVTNRNNTIEIFKGLIDNGVNVLIITHDFYIPNKIGGMVCVMKDGCIIERGDAKEIVVCPKEEYTKNLILCSKLSSIEGEK